MLFCLSVGVVYMRTVPSCKLAMSPQIKPWIVNRHGCVILKYSNLRQSVYTWLCIYFSRVESLFTQQVLDSTHQVQLPHPRLGFRFNPCLDKALEVHKCYLLCIVCIYDLLIYVYIDIDSYTYIVPSRKFAISPHI